MFIRAGTAGSKYCRKASLGLKRRHPQKDCGRRCSVYPQSHIQLYGRDIFGASVAELRSPGKQRVLVQMRETKSCEVSLLGCISVWCCHCPFSLSSALSSPEAAIHSVVPEGFLGFVHQFWHRLFWWFQNLPLLKPGIANLHANLDMLGFLAVLIQDF